MPFDPSNALRFGQGFFPPNLVAIGHFKANWPLVDPSWPLHDLWPQQCTTLWSGVVLTKFGSHRAFLRQIDLWMTFDPGWGHSENMPTNLVDPSPTPMLSFSSIPRSMTKRIAGHTYTHTHTHTNRLHYFSSIDEYMQVGVKGCHLPCIPSPQLVKTSPMVGLYKCTPYTQQNKTPNKQYIYSVVMGEVHPWPKIGMFCALSQNYDHICIYYFQKGVDNFEIEHKTC